MRSLACALALTVSLAGPVLASDAELPGQVSWAAYSALARDQAAAIGQALRREAGVELRVHAADTDRSGVDMLLKGQADFSATAIGGSVTAQEGVFQFADKDWGPQRVRLVLANTAEPLNYDLVIAGDLKIQHHAGLKGKRVAWFTRFPVINVNTAAFLAYGGLTWNDVQRVDVQGFLDTGLKALMNGEVDATFAPTNTFLTDEAAAGPRGLYWPDLNDPDPAAMARLLAVAPYFVPHRAAHGAGLHQGGHHGAHYPYPILVTLQGTDEGLVYGMTKALLDLYPHYQGNVLGIDGWRFDEQYLKWFVPYHEGTIRLLKERGLWTAAAQSHHDMLSARQEALAEAWRATKEENPANWASAWEERRRQALKSGGFQVVF